MPNLLTPPKALDAIAGESTTVPDVAGVNDRSPYPGLGT